MSNNSDFRIAIIGFGFLGSAIAHGFGLHTDIKIYDKYKPGFNSLEDTVAHAEFIFFCLPTPMFDDNGEQDLSILEGAVAAAHELTPENSDKIAIIKSTVLPGTNKRFQEKYPKLHFISNPEFLTARNNRLDFINASRNIIGGESPWVDKVEALYKHRFGNSLLQFKTDWLSAETTKYAANCFFMVKVNYFNFIYDLCQKLGIKYDDVKDMVLADGRIGRSHCDVPGHDLGRGASGACFPKDINALRHMSNQLGLEAEILDATWAQNLRLRPEKDWEQLPGVISKRNK